MKEEKKIWSLITAYSESSEKLTIETQIPYTLQNQYIVSDLRRSFPNNIKFVTPDHIQIQYLEICLSYCKNNSYNYGFIFLAGFLLLVVDDINLAFHIFKYVMETLNHLSLFSPLSTKEFQPISHPQKYLFKIIAKASPVLYKLLNSIGALDESLGYRWRAFFFLDALPFNYVIRFFDLYLIYGEPLLNSGIVAYCQIFEKRFNLKNLEEFFVLKLDNTYAEEFLEKSVQNIKYFK